MDRRVKVGLVGCGSVAQRGILPHLAEEDAGEVVELVAVCDVIEERAREIADRFRVRESYSELEEMLEQADIEAVLIATPIPFHYANAMAAVQANKHVYVQKTMTSTLAEAESLVEAARSRGVKLVASPGQMLSPAYQHLRNLLQRSTIGRVYWAISSTAWIGHEHEPFRADSDVDPTWYYKPGGGPMYDMAVYALHALTGVLGPARRVTALSGIGLSSRHWRAQSIQVEMDDNTLLLLDFGDSTFAVVGGHFCHAGRVINWGFLGFYGTEGAIEVTALEPESGYPARIEALNPGVLDGTLGFPRGAYTALTMPEPSPYITGPHAHLPEAQVWADIRHLVDCILHDREPIASGEHARHVIEIIEKGYLAAQTGQIQEIRTRF